MTSQHRNQSVWVPDEFWGWESNPELHQIWAETRFQRSLFDVITSCLIFHLCQKLSLASDYLMNRPFDTTFGACEVMMKHYMLMDWYDPSILFVVIRRSESIYAMFRTVSVVNLGATKQWIKLVPVSTKHLPELVDVSDLLYDGLIILDFCFAVACQSMYIFWWFGIHIYRLKRKITGLQWHLVWEWKDRFFCYLGVNGIWFGYRYAPLGRLWYMIVLEM